MAQSDVPRQSVALQAAVEHSNIFSQQHLVTRKRRIHPIFYSIAVSISPDVSRHVLSDLVKPFDTTFSDVFYSHPAISENRLKRPHPLPQTFGLDRKTLRKAIAKLP